MQEGQRVSPGCVWGGLSGLVMEEVGSVSSSVGRGILGGD